MLPQCLLLAASAFSLVSAGPVRVKRCAEKPTLTPPGPDAPPAGPDAAPAGPGALPAGPGAPSSSTPKPPTPGGEPFIPTLPKTEGGELPTYTGEFARIGAGHGIQNYTCPSAGGTPSLVGALAVVYDVTALYPGSGREALGEAAWTELTSGLLRDTELPLNAAEGSSPYAADGQNPFRPDAPVVVGGATLEVLGHHFFDAAGTPTFDLYAAGERLACAKAGNVAAPGTADPGPLDTGAVDWLYLTAKEGSVGLGAVYRVNTAGGNPLKCDAAGQTFSVPYASQYWFYT